MTGIAIEDLRREFWVFYLQNSDVVDDCPTFDSNRWVPMMSDGAVILSLGIRQTGGATVFLRGRIDAGVDTAGPILMPHEAELKKKLMTATTHQSDANSARYFRTSNPEADFRLPNLWPDVTAWFDNSVLRYRQVLTEVLGDA